ncbi:MAG: SAM-dependent methyltransferase [Ignavibacteria bacterium]
MNKVYWDKRYREGETGWDVGSVSGPLKEYIDQLEYRGMKILVPGAGNAYEAEYLFLKGFRKVHVLDISTVAIEGFVNRFPDFPRSQIINEDFFRHDGKYDLIIEQTFFCAIERRLRAEYAEKAFNLLNDNGTITGLLFNHEFGKDEPPYGGTKEEYEKYFSPFFITEIFEPAYNSIKPRAGRELFFKFRKKKLK